MHRGLPKGGRLMPCPSGFEVFGLDFLVQSDMPEQGPTRSSPASTFIAAPWRLALLECNEGPALGALARPDLCKAIISDMWVACVDPVLAAAVHLAREVEPKGSYADSHVRVAASSAEPIHAAAAGKAKSETGARLEQNTSLSGRETSAAVHALADHCPEVYGTIEDG